MSTVRTYDVAIIGGGVIGLSIAHALMASRPQRRVCVIEAQTGSREASWAAAGMLAPYTDFPLDDPLGNLAHDSMVMYPEFVAALHASSGLPCTLLETGSFMPELSGTHSEQIDALLPRLDTRGIAYELLEGTAARRKEPALSADVQRALWLPEGSVNNRQLWDALAESCRRSGVELLLGHPVRAVNVHDDRVTSVRAIDEDIHAETFVVAAGAWSRDIGDLLGIQFPMVPIKGQMQRFDVPDDALSHTVQHDHTYVVPRPGYGIIVGSTLEDRGFDQTVETDTLAAMARDAARLVPALAERTPCETWAGLRPKAPDGLPILGWAPGSDNIALASGHFRNGILLTPITGHIIAELVDGTLQRDIRAFDPARF